MAAYPVRTVRRGRCRPRGTSAVRHRHLLSKQKPYQPRQEVRLVWHKGSRKDCSLNSSSGAGHYQNDRYSLNERICFCIPIILRRRRRVEEVGAGCGELCAFVSAMFSVVPFHSQLSNVRPRSTRLVRCTMGCSTATTRHTPVLDLFSQRSACGGGMGRVSNRSATPSRMVWR